MRNKESHVTERGQITIDRDVRRQLGVVPGMVAWQRVVDGHLEITFLPDLSGRGRFGALHRDGESVLVTPEDLEEAVMEALAEGREQSSAENS